MGIGCIICAPINALIKQALGATPRRSI